jgi:hypothetical protein
MISIVICSIDPEKFAAVEKPYARHIGDEPFEIPERFQAKHAAHLATDAERWIEVRRRVHTHEEILAAYDMAKLCALTDEIQRRV